MRTIPLVLTTRLPDRLQPVFNSGTLLQWRSDFLRGVHRRAVDGAAFIWQKRCRYEVLVVRPIQVACRTEHQHYMLVNWSTPIGPSPGQEPLWWVDAACGARKRPSSGGHSSSRTSLERATKFAAEGGADGNGHSFSSILQDLQAHRQRRGASAISPHPPPACRLSNPDQ